MEYSWKRGTLGVDNKLWACFKSCPAYSTLKQKHSSQAQQGKFSVMNYARMFVAWNLKTDNTTVSVMNRETNLRLITDDVDAAWVDESDDAVGVVTRQKLCGHWQAVHIHGDGRAGHLRDGTHTHIENRVQPEGLRQIRREMESWSTNNTKTGITTIHAQPSTVAWCRQLTDAACCSSVRVLV